MKRRKILKIFLMIAPLLMILSVYDKLPELVPVHWGINGEVDRYGSKNELFLLGGMNILFGILMPVLAKVDPKKKNYERFEGTYNWMILCTMGFMTLMTGVTLIETLHPGTINISRVVCGMVAILFIAIGNVMPKVKSNFFTGVKTPWALSSDTVWNKTQRLGGKGMVIGGILLLISALLNAGQLMVIMVIGVTLFVCIVPTVMSYIWYRKELEK